MLINLIIPTKMPRSKCSIINIECIRVHDITVRFLHDHETINRIKLSRLINNMIELHYSMNYAPNAVDTMKKKSI